MHYASGMLYRDAAATYSGPGLEVDGFEKLRQRDVEAGAVAA